MPRRLLHAETLLELPAGRSALLYVKWPPGIHGPRGPVENIGRFGVQSANGEDVHWVRDRSDPFRFFVDAPEAGLYTVSVTYITNQPSTNSKSIDSYGYPHQGVINANTVTIYPEGMPISEILVHASLLLPEGWTHGSALTASGEKEGVVQFAPTTFEDFIDKPIILGRFLKTFELAVTPSARWFLHVSADEAQFIPEEDDSLLVPIQNLCLESEALFGRTHFEEYHFLLSLSDHHGLGVEHRNSSLNSDDPDIFDDKDWLETGIETLLPHEVGHAWCGKYRRPAGMLTEDFHVAKDTELLWVYEGLDSYLDWLLTARAGFRTIELMRETLAYGSASLVHQKGREWRPLGDTAVAGWTLRGGSKHWHWLRRGQDYYNEGSFIWLEVDTRIRVSTGEKKTLDDFCAAFFGHGDPDAHAVPFDRREIIETLNNLAPYDWAELFAERVDQAPGTAVPEGLERSGWKLVLSGEKPEYVQAVEKSRKDSRYFDSVGFSVNDEGEIRSIVPGSPADEAGLLDGQEILGINGRRFSSDRLEDAVRETSEAGKIDLLIDEAETLIEYTVQYNGGLQYFVLERDEAQPDRLSEIFESRRP